MAHAEVYDEVDGGSGDINLQFERIGFGRFQIVALLILCLGYFSYSSTTSLVAILEPYLRCQWNLSYMTAALIVLPEAIFNIAGSILLGRMSDKYGRREVMILTFFFHSYLSLLFSQSSSKILLAVLRGVIGLVSSTSSVISFTYAMEILPTSKRKYMSLFAIAYFAGCGTGIVAAMFSLEHLTWPWFVVFSETIPIALSGLAVIYLPESPRYLMTIGRSDEANEIMKKIAKMNGVDLAYARLPDGDLLNDDCMKKLGNDESPLKYTRHEMIKRIVVVSFLQFSGFAIASTTRYGSMQFGENSRTSGCGQCLSNLTYKYRWAVEFAVLFSAIASFLFVERLSRRLAMKILFTCIATSLVPFYWNLRGLPLILAITLTNGASSTQTTVITVYRAELFPTSLRTSGCGIADAFGQLGTLVGQFIALYLYHFNTSLSFGILLGLAILSILIVFVGLEETKNQQLIE